MACLNFSNFDGIRSSLTWICEAWRSIVMIWSAPAVDNMLATSLAEIGARLWRKTHQSFWKLVIQQTWGKFIGASSWDYGTFRPAWTHSSNAHTQPSSGATCLIFGRTLRLLPYFMCANSEGSPEPPLVVCVISTIISWTGSICLFDLGVYGPVMPEMLKFVQDMQSRDSCVQRETSSSITLLPTGTIKVRWKVVPGK